MKHSADGARVPRLRGRPRSGPEREVDHYGSDTSRYDQYGSALGEAPKIQDNLCIRNCAAACFVTVRRGVQQVAASTTQSLTSGEVSTLGSTEFDVTLPDSACVYCGNCMGSADGAIQFKTEYDLRQADDWRPRIKTSPERSAPTAVSAATSNTPRTTRSWSSPADHSVTSGMSASRHSVGNTSSRSTSTAKPEPGGRRRSAGQVALGRADTAGLVHHVQQAVVGIS